MYNSAVMARKSLAKNTSDFSGVWGNDRIIVFRHDICHGIRKEFYSADAVYTSMAWRDGYKKFTENTIASDTTFEQYVKGVADTVRKLNVPAFILCGASFVKKMEPDNTINVYFKLHRYPNAKVAIFNYKGDLLVRDEDELRAFIGNNFNVVLDPCCGYGNTAKFCKKVILSDINNDCLNHIVQEYGLSELKGE